MCVIGCPVENKLKLKALSACLGSWQNNQNGFRQNRSTVQQVLDFRCLIEGIMRRNLSAVITSIDFNKTFDYMFLYYMVIPLLNIYL
jgi:hypothetical protein